MDSDTVFKRTVLEKHAFQFRALKYRVIRNDCRGFNNLVLQIQPHEISFYGVSIQSFKVQSYSK